MEPLIQAICQKEGLDARDIQPLSGGQVNQVFLVDHTYVMRIGRREDAFSRLKQESGLLQRLRDEIPVPRVLAFGQQEGHAYQIQQFVRGQKLHLAWKLLSPEAQDRIIAELASYLRTLHRVGFPDYGYLFAQAGRYASWQDFLSAEFQNTLAEIRALGLRINPDLLAKAADYFSEHQSSLQEGAARLVHGDLWLGNILVEEETITAILDFEFALQAPADFELLKMEDFCLYPNDYAEEEKEIFCTADFANLFALLRKHDPELFSIGRLRERVNLYHLESALSDYVAWRKANLATIPPESTQAMEFINARISNILFDHGTRMF